MSAFPCQDGWQAADLSHRYTWSSVFTNLLLVAYDFLCEFLPTKMYRVGVFLAIGVVLILINGLGVKAS